MTSSQREAIDIMKRMDTVTVIPALVAQALGMNPDVLRKHARDGEYKISAFEVTGNTVRFFRKDFLQKIGEMDPDPEARTDSDRLDEIIELIRVFTNGCTLSGSGFGSGTATFRAIIPARIRMEMIIGTRFLI